MTLVVNTVEQGESAVILRPTDVLVPASVLSDAGLRHDQARRETIDHRLYVSLASMAPRVTYQVDVANLAVRITAPPDLLGRTVINLSGVEPSQIEHHTDTSGFVNYALRLQDAESLSSFVEGGLSLKGALLYSSASLNPNSWVPVRGQTNLTIDDRTRLERFVFGDSFASSGLLGGGMFLGGVTFQRSFDIDPYFYRFPSFGYAGAVMTPSTVDVYVNNVLVRRETIQPGTFQISNLPVTAGSGSTRYVLRDAFGNETDLSSHYYLSTGALAKGLSDYSYSLGFRRDNVGISSFDYGYDGLTFLGRHRVGINNWLTAGARLEAAVDLVSGGATASFLTPIGELQLAGAGSAATGGVGASGLLSYAYLCRYISTNLYATVSSDHYATSSLRAVDDRPTVQVAATIAVPIVSRASVSLQGGLSDMRDAGLSTHVGGLASVRITRSLALLLSADLSTSPLQSASFDAFASLNYTFGNNMLGSIGWQHSNGHDDATVELNKPLPRGEGIGYRFQGLIGPGPTNASGQAQYQTSFGRYTAEYDYIEGQPHTVIEAAGSIAAVRHGGVFASRPINDAYGLIQLPGVAGARGYLNNLLVGRTDRHGNLLVPDLQSYYGNQLSVDDRDIPLDRTIDQTAREVAPALRGVARVRFLAMRTQYARGKLVVELDDKPVVPAWGDLTLKSGMQLLESPIGKDGEFELEDARPGTYQAELEWDGGTCQMDLVVPNLEANIVELGTLTCTVPKN